MNALSKKMILFSIGLFLMQSISAMDYRSLGKEWAIGDEQERFLADLGLFQDESDNRLINQLIERSKNSAINGRTDGRMIDVTNNSKSKKRPVVVKQFSGKENNRSK